MSRSNIMIIPTSSIITAVDITDRASEQYNEFLKFNESQEETEFDPEEHSGEDIFRQLMEAVAARSDEQLDDEDDYERATRTYH